MSLFHAKVMLHSAARYSTALIVVLCLLWAGLAHSQHFELDEQHSQLVEVECGVCNFANYTPPENLSVTPFSSNVLFIDTGYQSILDFENKCFFNVSLRGPPSQMTLLK